MKRNDQDSSILMNSYRTSLLRDIGPSFSRGCWLWVEHVAGCETAFAVKIPSVATDEIVRVTDDPMDLGRYLTK